MVSSTQKQCRYTVWPDHNLMALCKELFWVTLLKTCAQAVAAGGYRQAVTQRRSFYCLLLAEQKHCHQVWVSHKAVAEDARLLECNAMCNGKWFPAFQRIVLPHLQQNRTAFSCRWKQQSFHLSEQFNQQHSFTFQKTWILKKQKNTVLNRISTQYYKTVYDRKTQSYLHFTMCNGEQFIELYVKGTINGIKLRYSGKKTNPCF